MGQTRLVGAHFYDGDQCILCILCHKSPGQARLQVHARGLEVHAGPGTDQQPLPGDRGATLEGQGACSIDSWPFDQAAGQLEPPLCGL